MTPTAGHFCLPLRVYIEDTDAGGIVYYANYLRFLERARTEYLRRLGFDKAAVPGFEALFVVHSVQIRYRAPARLDEQLTVSVVPQRVTPASVLFSQCVYRDAQRLCDAEVRIACIGRDDFRPLRMPDRLYRILSDQLRAEGDTSP